MNPLDMVGVDEEEAYAYGFDALDALDELHHREALRLVWEWDRALVAP